MRTFGLGYVILNVDNLEETLEWYANKFYYNKKFGEFSITGSDGKVIEYKILVNPTGGLPIVFRRPMNTRMWDAQEPLLDRLGVLGVKIKTDRVRRLFYDMKYEGVGIKSGLAFTPPQSESFWLRDSNGMMIQVYGHDDFLRRDSKILSGGVSGLMIGVTDLDAAIEYYSHYGYTDVIYRGKNVFEDLKAFNNCRREVNRAILELEPRKGGLSLFTGITHLDLIEIVPDISSREIEPDVKGFYKFAFNVQEIEKGASFLPALELQTLDNDFVSLVNAQVQYDGEEFYLSEIFSLKFRKVLPLRIRRNYQIKNVPAYKLNFLLKNAMYNLI